MTSRSWSHVLYLAIVLLLAANLVVMVVGKSKPSKHQYRLISPAQEPNALQKAMNEAGAQGFKYEDAIAESHYSTPLLIFGK